MHGRISKGAEFQDEPERQLRSGLLRRVVASIYRDVSIILYDSGLQHPQFARQAWFEATTHHLVTASIRT